MQLLRVTVDLGAMAMKGFSAFPKAPASLEPQNQILLCHIQDTRFGRSFLSTEMQSVNSTAPAAWTNNVSAKQRPRYNRPKLLMSRPVSVI